MAKLVLLATLGSLAFIVYMISFRDPTEAGVEEALTASFGYQGAQCEEVATLASDDVFRCVVVRGLPLNASGHPVTRCYWVDADGAASDGSFAPCQGLQRS